MLTLGWSDGYSFVPVDFAMLSSVKAQNRLNPGFPSFYTQKTARNTEQ